MVLNFGQGANGLFPASEATGDGLINLREETYPKEQKAVASTSGGFDGINNTAYATLTGMTITFTVEKKGFYLILFDCELIYQSEVILDRRGCDIAIFDDTTNLREKHQNIFLEDSGDGDACATYSASAVNSIWDFSMNHLVELEEGSHTITIQGKRDSNTRYATQKREIIITKIVSSD